MANQNMNRYKNHQQGMTLIELMIAVIISITLLSGLIEVYLGSKQSYNLVEESSRLQENGRFALEIMTREIRGADFYGCLRDPDSNTLTNNLNMASSEYSAAQHEFGESLAGFDNLTLDGIASTSDSISFSGATGGSINVSTGPGDGANLDIEVNSGLNQYDIVIISDCSGGDIFEINNASPDSGTIVHNTGNPGVGNGPGNSNSNPDCNVANKHCLSKDYPNGANIYKVGRVGYDIRPGFNGNNGLFRTGNDGNAIEIIENVENLQVLYGEDTDEDRFHTPNQYVNATNIGYVNNANAGRIGNAITVRISLLLKGERDLLPQNTNQSHQLLDVTIATNDRRIYKIFSTTITIRNRALIDTK